MKPHEIRIEPVVSVPFEENSYLVYAAECEEVVVVDPGLEPGRILGEIERLGKVLSAILVTHGHGDHIGGSAALKQRWPDCPLVIGEIDAPMLTDPHLNLSASFGLPFQSPAADVKLSDGAVYEAAGLRFHTALAAGHTPGHVVYVVEGTQPLQVLVGDVIFAGSVGRTDFPGGSFSQLAASIRRALYSLPDDTVLWPGHGPSTTVGEEKRSNPFVSER